MEQARKILAEFVTEDVRTIEFFLQQGREAYSREILLEAVAKVNSLGPAKDQINRELFDNCKHLLEKMNAEHLIHQFLVEAIKSKNIEILEDVCAKAKTLKMSEMNYPEVGTANKLLDELKKKAAKKSQGGGLFGMNLGGKKKEEEKKMTVEPAIFGVPLVEALRLSGRDGIPQVCIDCVVYLRANGLTEDGLFRVPGNNDAMDAIRRSYDRGQPLPLDNTHDTAGVLKLFFRRLPEPLIPFDCYAPLLEKAKTSSSMSPAEFNEAISKIISCIPPSNLTLLRFLMDFLREVTTHSAVNRMVPDNVAVCFAPNLLRPRVETAASMMGEMPLTIKIVSLFMSAFSTIFPTPIT